MYRYCIVSRKKTKYRIKSKKAYRSGVFLTAEEQLDKCQPARGSGTLVWPWKPQYSGISSLLKQLNFVCSNQCVKRKHSLDWINACTVTTRTNIFTLRFYITKVFRGSFEKNRRSFHQISVSPNDTHDQMKSLSSDWSRSRRLRPSAAFIYLFKQLYFILYFICRCTIKTIDIC